MILSTLFILAGFFLMRALALRTGLGTVPAAIFPAAVCLAFVGGSILRPWSLPNSQPEAVAIPSAPSVVPAPAGGRTALSVDQMADLRPGGGGALGSVDVVQLSSDRKSVAVSGWVTALGTTSAPRGIVLLVDGRVRADATKCGGRERPDVAKALGSGAAEYSGFAGARFSVAGLSKGKHVVSVAAVSDDDRYRVAPLSHSFVL